MHPIVPDDEKRLFARLLDTDLFRSYRRSPVAIVASVIVVVLVLAAFLAPWIAPYDPFNTRTLNLRDGFTPPNTVSATGKYFLLGSDHQGRDVFSAILYGSRVSLTVGLLATLFAMVLGVTLGLIAGFRGGFVDMVITRAADVQLSFPSILIALLIFGIARGIIPPSRGENTAIVVLIISIGLSDWAQFARTVRGATMVERQKDYVSAARILGGRQFHLLLRHILPNVLGPVLVIGTIGLALAIISEATLSFLGVGVPPTQPSLGTLIRIGQQFLFSGEWWILVFPALALVLLAMSVNLLGDWLRDALNPRLR